LDYLKRELDVIHRDIKPSNVLLSRSGHVKMCDFGISGYLVNSLAKTMVGSQNYMAVSPIYHCHWLSGRIAALASCGLLLLVD